MCSTILATVIVFTTKVECTHVSERVAICDWQETPSGEHGTEVCVDGECFDITSALEW